MKCSRVYLACLLALGGSHVEAADYSGPKLRGENLSITCPWTGEEAERFRQVVAVFEKATGVTAQLQCSQSSEQEIIRQARAGSSTNITFIPQPGLVGQLAVMGALTPLGEQTRAWVQKNYAAGSSWSSLGTFVGSKGRPEFYGLAYNVNIKSLVWYIPKRFEERGYKVPRTLGQLEALTARMVADGLTPWCIGQESAAASGWPATDWVEDFLLRQQPPKVYDDWVTHRILFSDPRVMDAMRAYGRIALDTKQVAGGAKAVVSTSFKESPRGLFGAKPSCYLHRQASFISSFFPEQEAKDADFFYFPSAPEKNLGFPALGGGTLATITRDSKASRAFIEYLQHPQSHEAWMALGGFLTPHRGVDRLKYRDKLQQKAGDILLGATTFRFDGSDLMPAAVGAGSFWKGMNDYINGKPLEAVAADIDESWKTLK